MRAVLAADADCLMQFAFPLERLPRELFHQTFLVLPSSIHRTLC